MVVVSVRNGEPVETAMSGVSTELLALSAALLNGTGESTSSASSAQGKASCSGVRLEQRNLAAHVSSSNLQDTSGAKYLLFEAHICVHVWETDHGAQE